MTAEFIKDINYIYYSSYRDFVKSPHSLIVCYLFFFYRMLKSLIKWQFSYKELREILFVIPSINNKKSVRTIADNISSQYCSEWGNFAVDIPQSEIFLRSVSHLRLFHKLYRKSSDEDKRLIRQFFMQFMTTSGMYYTLKRILNANPQLKMIVLANDHVVISRCLIALATEMNIKTLYVQHASVTERFPPLHFSYSFLDGMESYEKYKTIGDIRGKVFLSGSPRFDELYKYKNATKVFDVGIALNEFDSCDMVMELCKYLQLNISKRIAVRPHPRMGKLFNSQLFKDAGIEISDSTKESSFSFLSKVKFLIANESSIHLDSALIGVPSLLYNFSKEEVKDWYSYIKNGLITVCSTYDEVSNAIRNQHDCLQDKVRYYNAAYNTPYEGQVGKLVADFIKNDVLADNRQDYIKTIMKETDGKYIFIN